MRVAARRIVLDGALIAALGGLSCTAASTSVAAPTSGKCRITATNQPSSFPHGGGRGSVTIATARDCTWSVSTDAPWIDIAGDRSGQGQAVLNYTVSENPVPTSRAAAISVESARLELSQAAAVYVRAESQRRIDRRDGRQPLLRGLNVDGMLVERDE